MGWRPGFLGEMQDAEQVEAGRSACGSLQEAHLRVLPAEDRSLPDRAVPELAVPPLSVGRARAGRRYGATSSRRAAPSVEGSTEDPVSEGTEGKR